MVGDLYSAMVLHALLVLFKMRPSISVSALATCSPVALYISGFKSILVAIIEYSAIIYTLFLIHTDYITNELNVKRVKYINNILLILILIH